jgi:hypothetical protein
MCVFIGVPAVTVNVSLTISKMKIINIKTMVKK